MIYGLNESLLSRKAPEGFPKEEFVKVAKDVVSAFERALKVDKSEASAKEEFFDTVMENISKTIGGEKYKNVFAFTIPTNILKAADIDGIDACAKLVSNVYSKCGFKDIGNKHAIILHRASKDKSCKYAFYHMGDKAEIDYKKWDKKGITCMVLCDKKHKSTVNESTEPTSVFSVIDFI